MRRTGIVAALLAAGLALGLVTAPALAQMQIGLRAFEIRAGYTDLEDDAGSTFIISGAADMGVLTAPLAIELNADFWTKSWDADTDADWKWTNFAVLANVRYPFVLAQSPFHPFVFGGLGLHYFKSDFDCPVCEDEFEEIFEDAGDESEIEFGLDLGAGADFGSGDGILPTARVGFNTNGGADYFFISGGIKIPAGK